MFEEVENRSRNIRASFKRAFRIWVTMFLMVETAAAQDATFEASVDKSPVGVGDQFTLSLTLRNAGVGSGKNLQLPDLSNFHIMGGPNQSSSVQFINGQVSSSVTYSYVLQPREIGMFTIGSASIEAGGKVYTTSPVQIEVVKGVARSTPQASAPPDLADQIGDNLFLKATVDRSRVIQGEQINLMIKLYTRLPGTDITDIKFPTMKGFWQEDIGNPKTYEQTRETVNGKEYIVAIIRKMILFPTQSGTLEISPMEVRTTVQVRSRSFDPFDSFFGNPFGRTVPYALKTDPLKIRVDPLPAGAPAGFKGAIGTFKMSSTVDKRTTKTNEPVTLKITIGGTGNIKLLESPEVALPADFEQYTPKVSENIDREQGKIVGSKTFELLLIPRYPGQKTIKPVSFCYFDIDRREYVTLRSPAIELTVEQGAASPAPLITGGPRADVQLLSQDIRFIKVVGGGFSRRGEDLYTSGVFMVLLTLPLAGLIGAFVYSRRRESVMLDEAGYRNRRAIKVAQKGLKTAEELLRGTVSGKTIPSSEYKIQFYAEVSRALWKYLVDKLNIPPAELSIDGTVARLARRSIDGATASSLKSLLESCEIARFAPTSLEPSAMRKTYEEARRIIVELERTLRSR
jgi:hypothetical protein